MYEVLIFKAGKQALSGNVYSVEAVRQIYESFLHRMSTDRLGVGEFIISHSELPTPHSHYLNLELSAFTVNNMRLSEDGTELYATVSILDTPRGEVMRLYLTETKFTPFMIGKFDGVEVIPSSIEYLRVVGFVPHLVNAVKTDTMLVNT